MKRNTKAIAGAMALSLAAASGGQAATVYIPEGSAGEVLVVDSATDTPVDRIGGLADVHGLGGTSGGYLVAGSSAAISADKGPAVAKPAGVSEEEHEAHHAPGNRPAAEAVSILTVINAADGAPVRRLEVPGAVHHVAVSPDGRYAVATHPKADGVSVIDLSDLSVRDLVPTGPGANYAVFSTDGAKVYVSNTGNGTVSEIDAGRWFVQRNLVAGDKPEHMVMATDGQTLYVANIEAGTVSALAIDQGKITRSFAIGGELHGLDISDDGGVLFVSGKGENKLVAIDLQSGEMRSAPLGPAPYHLAVIRGTDKLYVSSRKEPKVWVVDQKTLTARGSIAIRGEGHQMVVAP